MEDCLNGVRVVVDPVRVVPLIEEAVHTNVAVQAVLHHVEVVRRVQVVPAIGDTGNTAMHMILNMLKFMHMMAVKGER
jgi:hypothetical protein